MSAPQNLAVEVVKLHPQATIPTYAKFGDAGADLYSVEEKLIKPGQRTLVKTGIAIALPLGYVGLVHPRSGLALKNGISVVNTPGTIDSGYRGEIKIILINTDAKETFEVKRGDRIAQLVFQTFESARFFEVEQLPESKRGGGGFGSTGA